MQIYSSYWSWISAFTACCLAWSFLSFLGLTFAPELHDLFISDHHLLLYFMLLAFLLGSLLTLQFQYLLLFGVIHDVPAPMEKLALHGLVLGCKQLCGLLLLL